MANTIDQEKLAKKMADNDIFEVGEQKRAQTVGLTEFMRSQIEDMFSKSIKSVELKYREDASRACRDNLIEGIKIGFRLARESLE